MALVTEVESVRCLRLGVGVESWALKGVRLSRRDRNHILWSGPARLPLSENHTRFRVSSTRKWQFQRPVGASQVPGTQARDQTTGNG